MTNERDYYNGLYSAIFADIWAAKPQYRSYGERDLAFIKTQLEHCGSHFVTIALPDLGKHFDKCLSEGRYALPIGKKPLAPYRKGSNIPRLFGEMLLAVFELDGSVRSDADSETILYLRQLYYGCKKIRKECDDHRRYKAVADFFTTESVLPNPTLEWGQDVLGDRIPAGFSLSVYCDRSPLPLYDRGGGYQGLEGLLFTIGKVSDLILSEMGLFHDVESRHDLRPKHGPGAVSDRVKGGHFSKWSFPTWPERLDIFFPKDRYGVHNSAALLHEDVSSVGFQDHRSGSNLILVPKTQKGPRLIASEPTCNQYIQQILRAYFEHEVSSGLLEGFIDFRRQDLSREMAKRASSDGELITIDLASASDRLSCHLVERIFRSRFDLLELMNSCRTSYVVNTLDKKHHRYLELKKFAPMGSALTFPIQSIVFTLLTIGATLYSRGIPVSRQAIRKLEGEVRVFGDDIIAPKDSTEALLAAITAVGLEVNISKSHVNGLLRESCGMDAYAGVCVTPAYVLETSGAKPGEVVSVVETANNFHWKGFWRTAAYLMTKVKKKVYDRLPILGPKPGIFGMRSFTKGWLPRFTTWDPHYQEDGSRLLSLHSKDKSVFPGGNLSVTRFLFSLYRPGIPWSHKEPSRPQVITRLRRVPTRLLMETW